MAKNYFPLSLFCSKIVLIAVQDSGGNIGRKGLSVLRMFNRRVTSVFRGSLAFYGYVGRGRRRYWARIVQKKRGKGPSELRTNVLFSVSRGMFLEDKSILTVKPAIDSSAHIANTMLFSLSIFGV